MDDSPVRDTVVAWVEDAGADTNATRASVVPSSPVTQVAQVSSASARHPGRRRARLADTPSGWRQGSRLAVDPGELRLVHELVAEVLSGTLDEETQEDVVNVQLSQWVERNMQAEHEPVEARKEVNKCFQGVYGIICHHLRDTSNKMPDAVMGMWQQLMLGSREAYWFYSRGAMYTPDSEEGKAVESKFGRMPAGGASPFFVDNMRVFGQLGGFESVLARLRDMDARASPMSDMVMMVTWVCICRLCFQPAFGVAYVNELAKLVLRRAEGMGDDEAASFDMQLISELTTNLRESVAHLTPEQDARGVANSVKFALLRRVLDSGVLEEDPDLLDTWVDCAAGRNKPFHKLRDPQVRDASADTVHVSGSKLRDVLVALGLLPRASLRDLSIGTGFEFVTPTCAPRWCEVVNKMPALTALSISWDITPNDTLAVLASSLVHLPVLSALEVHSHISHAAAVTLAAGLKTCTALTRLALRACFEDGARHTILAQLRTSAPLLTDLDVTSLGAGSWDNKSVATAASLLKVAEHLQTLALKQNRGAGMSPLQLSTVCAALPPSLTRLDVTHQHGIMPHLAPELARLSRLQTLILTGSSVYDPTVSEAVLAGISASRITGIQLGADTPPALIDALPPSVERFTMSPAPSRQVTTGDTFGAVSRLIRNLRLRELSILAGGVLRDTSLAQATALGGTLGGSSHLRRLALMLCNVPTAMATAILRKLPPSLESLEVHSRDGHVPIATALPKLTRLVWESELTGPIGGFLATNADDARESNYDWSLLPKCPRLMELTVGLSTVGRAVQRLCGLATVLPDCQRLQTLKVLRDGPTPGVAGSGGRLRPTFINRRCGM